MHVYLAGIYASSFDLQSTTFQRLTEPEKAARRGVTHILESYYYLRDGPMVEKIRQDGVRIFLDSGAYSAFTKGATILLDDYCTFIRDHMDVVATVDGVRMVSVLDVIGNAERTPRHQHRMEDDLSFAPIPCHHFGEDPAQLDHSINWKIRAYRLHE